MKLALLAAVALVWSPLAATAQGAGFELGVLDCTIDGGSGFIFGSTKNLRCTFTPSNQDYEPENYTGTVSKYGLDIGSTKEALLRWRVLGPSLDIYAPGALGGNYVGASAEVTASVGAGVNVLVGGSGPTFTLQPVSLQTQKGLNLALGVSQFQLRSADGETK